MIGFDDAIKFATRRHVVLPSQYYGELQGLARTLGFSVSGVIDLIVLEMVKNSIATAIRKGQTFAQWKTSVTTGAVSLELPNGRLRTILQTNVQNSVNRGRCTVFEARKDRLSYFVYDAVNDSKTRASHAAMDGYCARWDDPIWAIWAPINGYNCRCRLLQVSKWSAEPYLMRKPTPPDVMPDEGFDYNPCSDILRGNKEAIDNAAKSSVFAKTVRYVKETFSKWIGGLFR